MPQMWGNWNEHQDTRTLIHPPRILLPNRSYSEDWESLDSLICIYWGSVAQNDKFAIYTSGREMQSYTMERMPSGRFRYNAPDGIHDDTVIALALAWHGAQSGFYEPGSIAYAQQASIGYSSY